MKPTKRKYDLQVRIPAVLEKKLVRRAKESGRSVTREIAYLLQKSLTS